MLRVLVVEDSPTERELLVQVLGADPDIQVVGQAVDGVEAVQLAIELRPNLIAMDVYMPRMDGLAATREIMVQAPTPILLVSSSTNAQEVELTLQAMQAGALAVIEKPGHPDSAPFEQRRTRLLALAKALSEVRVVRRWAPPSALAEPVKPAGATISGRTRIVAIAASTGGPAALREILAALPANLPAPVLVVQHIARGFMKGLADWLQPHCALRVKIAEDGEPLIGGTVFLAPDDRHLGVRGDRRILLAADAPVGGFRPSATYLFQSVAEVLGTGVTGVILTGMGSDGVEGLRTVKTLGGTVLAQDECTSIVYGMPREAMKAGVVDTELPVSAIAPRLITLVGRYNGHHDPRR